jgi:peroxiredoxin
MTKHWTSWALAGIVAAVALASGLHFGGRAFQSADSPSGDGGAVAAVFGLTLPDAEGHELAFAQWRGKILVVNFWATWCAPCREEMPLFTTAQRQFGPKGLQFVGVAVDSADKVREFVHETRLGYPTVVGGYGAIELSRTLGNRVGALPFTVIVDRAGRVAHVQLGPFNEAKLNGIIEQLL